MNLQPYLSVDLETTGLDRKRSQILQVAAVWEDWKTPVDQLEHFNLLIRHQSIQYGEPYALWLNQWIFQEMAKPSGKYQIESVELAQRAFSAFVKALNYGKRITIGGKNAAGFDLPILENNGFDVSLFDHRVLDVGPMYFRHFGYVPGFGKIQEMLQRPAITHDALQDAKDVIIAARKEMGIPIE